jgi:hypothetical protein
MLQPTQNGRKMGIFTISKNKEYIYPPHQNTNLQQIYKKRKYHQFPWITNNENSPCDPIYHGTLIDLILIFFKC